MRYQLDLERIQSLKEYAIQRVRRRIVQKEFYALRDVNLQVKQGETLGIIGRNGAGKSTLLKTISRVIHPTVGRVQVRGWLAPLLELGAGFHPELTGRENVFLNGTLLGRTRREIRTRFDEIVTFAGIWEFIDAPIRTYSTGMVTRLGFAVATAWMPDILVLDEVLSVGDAEFQSKSTHRIREMHAFGTTILFVSHNLDAIQEMCDRVLWLDWGRVQALGDPRHVVELYKDETLELQQVNELIQRWGSTVELEAARRNGKVYDEHYFRFCCGHVYERNDAWLRLFDPIAQAIVERINPRTALDAGCAMGMLVERLRARGVDAFGIDVSEYALEHVGKATKPFCRLGSIVDPIEQRYDLILCIEVLQNLTEEEGRRAVANLCRATDDILFSANPSDRRSPTHVNVQPNEYWESLFAAHGFARDLNFDGSFVTPWAARFLRVS